MTTELPYTEADLRAEAARQHAYLAADPDFMGTGEQMEDSVVASTDDGTASRKTWNELLVAPTPDDEYDEYEAAQRKIHDLVNGAADLSEWAVNLGADGLEPTGHVLKVGSADKQIARIHFAFAPDLAEDVRLDLVEGLAQVIADSL